MRAVSLVHLCCAFIDGDEAPSEPTPSEGHAGPPRGGGLQSCPLGLREPQRSPRSLRSTFAGCLRSLRKHLRRPRGSSGAFGASPWGCLLVRLRSLWTRLRGLRCLLRRPLVVITCGAPRSVGRSFGGTDCAEGPVGRPYDRCH